MTVINKVICVGLKTKYIIYYSIIRFDPKRCNRSSTIETPRRLRDQDRRAITDLSERHDLTTTGAECTSVSLVARISNENSTELMCSALLSAAAFRGLDPVQVQYNFQVLRIALGISFYYSHETNRKSCLDGNPPLFPPPREENCNAQRPFPFLVFAPRPASVHDTSAPLHHCIIFPPAVCSFSRSFTQARGQIFFSFLTQKCFTHSTMFKH